MRRDRNEVMDVGWTSVEACLCHVMVKKWSICAIFRTSSSRRTPVRRDSLTVLKDPQLKDMQVRSSNATHLPSTCSARSSRAASDGPVSSCKLRIAIWNTFESIKVRASSVESLTRKDKE